MAMPFQELDERLQQLACLLGCSCVWKRTEYCLTEMRLQKNFKHRHIFCEQVKKNPAMRRACMRNDRVSMARKLHEAGGKPFVMECHAGALEMVIPVHGSGRVLGVVICGPFATAALPVDSGLLRWRHEWQKVLPEIVRALFSDMAGRLYSLNPVGNVEDERIVEVLNFIAANYSRQITLEQAAGRVFLSISRLSHLFKTVCGVDFTRYLSDYRLRVAADLLANSSLAIGEIAGRTGYNDQAHFSAMFRKSYLMTPGVYRKKNQRNTD